MELSQVRYFVTLCRTLNFTRAAAQCQVTQPAFTRAIQRLEDEFGGALIFRERSLTQLTELGRAVRPHLEAMLDAADAARSTADAKAGRRAEVLKIGLGPGIGAGEIGGVIHEVTRALPEVTIHFEEAGPAALIESMLTDKLDCALLPDFCDLPERLNRWTLYRDNAVAVLPPGHRLAGRNALTAGDLADETILHSEYCGGFATRLAATCPLRLQRCHGATAQMLDLVAAGIGIALLSDRLRIPPPLAARPFTDPDLSRAILLAVVAGRPLNPAAGNFLKLCRARRFA